MTTTLTVVQACIIRQTNCKCNTSLIKQAYCICFMLLTMLLLMLLLILHDFNNVHMEMASLICSLMRIHISKDFWMFCLMNMQENKSSTQSNKTQEVLVHIYSLLVAHMAPVSLHQPIICLSACLFRKSIHCPKSNDHEKCTESHRQTSSCKLLQH